MVAYVFPGQGSQFPGMGRELAAESAIAAEVYRVIDEALGFSLTEIMFGDDAEALVPTQVQQPAIFAHSVAAFAALRKRHPQGPAMVAGHSLGEYSALVAAGCVELDEAAQLVRRRGQLMAHAGETCGGAMVAIMKLDADAVQQIVEAASETGIVSVANYNCPGQTVVSGESDAVEKAGELAREHGGRAIPLKVSGAFHCPLMSPAADALAPHIEALRVVPADVPVVSNVDATPRTDPAGIKQALLGQVTGSVRWEDSVRRMISEGVDTFLEVGPGDVLAKIIRRIDEQVAVYPIGSLAQIEAFLQTLS